MRPSTGAREARRPVPTQHVGASTEVASSRALAQAHGIREATRAGRCGEWCRSVPSNNS
jgi:hypothetical protein